MAVVSLAQTAAAFPTKISNDRSILLTLTQIGVELVRHHPDRTV